MGNLPESRTETAIVGAAVSPNLINEIQDVIISEHADRIAARNAYMGGSRFVVDGGAPTRVGEVWTFTVASTQVVACGLWLPVGTVITDIVWSYNRNATTFQFNLFRRSFGNGGTTSDNPSQVTVNAGTGWTTVAASTVTGMPITILDGFYYLLSVTSTSSGSFDGCKLIVTPP